MFKNTTAKAAWMALACAFVLSACGGGGGSPSVSVNIPPAPPPPAPPKPVLIETYGDSTTVGYQGFTAAGSITPNNEPAVLQSILRNQFGQTITVSNQGVSGIEASQLLLGTDGVHPSWINQMAASRADVITLNLALNDPFYTVSLHDGVPAETPAQYAQAMTQLVQIAQSAGKKVVLFEPNATCEPIRQPLMPSYVQALRGVASAMSVPLVAEYDPFLELPDWQSLLSDCLHPTDAGYSIKAKWEYQTLAPIVASLLQ